MYFHERIPHCPKPRLELISCQHTADQTVSRERFTPARQNLFPFFLLIRRFRHFPHYLFMISFNV
jgi:hypothetical protein